MLSVLRLVALALDKYPTIFAGGQRGAVARLFGRLLPICTEANRSRCACAQVLPAVTGLTGWLQTHPAGNAGRNAG